MKRRTYFILFFILVSMGGFITLKIINRDTLVGASIEGTVIQKNSDYIIIESETSEQLSLLKKIFTLVILRQMMSLKLS